jgi:AraC family transcriptional regulator
MGRKLKSHRRFSQEHIRRVADYIRANLDEQLTLGDLACLVDLSPRQFFRIFSITFGTTPHRYIVNERVALAKELIFRGQMLVEIASVLGFASQSHFSGVFRKVTGMSPGRSGRTLRFQKFLDLHGALLAENRLVMRIDQSAPIFRTETRDSSSCVERGPS